MFQKVLLFILPIVLVYSCKTEEQKDIVNDFTENHQTIPGTKTSLIPPSNFKFSTSFSGFEQLSSGASIMVMEMPTSYDEIIVGFTKEGLLKQGVKEKSRSAFLINGYNATLIKAEQSVFDTDFTKSILTFGDESTTIMVNGISEKGDTELEKNIQTAILSTIYDPSLEVNKKDVLVFEVDITNTKLQFANVILGSAAYNVDGNSPTQALDKTKMIIGQSFYKVEITDPKKFAIERLKQLPTVADIDEENISEIIIDNMDGYEIVSYGKDLETLVPELTYQVMLFADNQYYLIIGNAKENFEENLALFKKIAVTFKRK